MDARLLGTEDVTLLEDFLREHRDSSMFLRSNLRRAGIEDHGQRFQATYAGAFRSGKLVGVAAHGWNGLLLLQAPDGLEPALRAAVAGSARKVGGFLGPAPQVKQARAALGLSAAPTRPTDSEWLLGLDLAELAVPEPLRIGFLECRPPLARERTLLCEWRAAYEVEALGAEPGPELSASVAQHIDGLMAEEQVWVALSRGTPVSMAACNAVLPEIVQLGGIYTPLPQRGRGFAQVAVAGALLALRQRGVSRAVLFTSNPSAVRTYERVGFRRVGEYAVQILVNAAQP